MDERSIVVRPETPRDRPAVRRVIIGAFGGRVEADLVEAIHRAGAATVALVAEFEGAVAGQILFSPVSVESGTTVGIVGLGPMAVAPALQRRGLGSRLVREGLNRCRAAGARAVVVLGHAHFYPRFGFRSAQTFGLRCEYDVPPDAFMALELVPRALRGVSGLVRYHSAFPSA